jgi:AraC family transcriptional regulator
MQSQTERMSAALPDGITAGFFVSRSDVAVLARLLDDAGSTLRSDVATAHGFLARANIVIASMLQAGGGSVAQPAASGGMAPWQVRRVRAEVEERLHQTLPIGELAASVRLSSSYFSRVFRTSFGCSPHAYILVRRIDRAKALISDGTIPLAQIAVECGLADQAHLCRMFRRHVGCTPGAWRRQISV